MKKRQSTGYSFWSASNPVIALRLRHKRIDNIAFTLMHEVGHIASHLAKDPEAQFIDIDGDKRNDSKEKEADEFAREKLIPKIVWEEIKGSRPFRNDKKSRN